MEGDPFALVEAMTIAAYATGCEHGFVYVRAEYPLAHARLENAFAQARARGLLGDDVMGAGFAFDLELRIGAGAYVCGEETALFQSIEGYRGEPRNKPPFPVEVGLFGKPTVVNNVETLFNVLDVVSDSGAAYAEIGTEVDRHAALLPLRPRRAARALRGAVRHARSATCSSSRAREPPKAVLLGGAAGSFLRPDQLDLPLTFEDARAAGATLGSGVVIVYDESADLVDAVLRIAEFFRDESCGQCVPCRVGTVRQEEALHRLAAGSANGNELDVLADLAQVMRDASICGLGQTAASAVAVGDDEPRSARAMTHRERRRAEAHVELTVDGAAVRVTEGSTILDACRRLGIETPTLCYADTLTPVNVCRVCVVEVEGARTLVPACSRKVEAGMVVHTDSRARAHEPPPGARAARLVGRPLHRARRAALHRASTTRSRSASARTRDRRAAGEGRQRPLRPRLLEVHPLLQVRRGLRRRPPEHVRDRRRRPRLRRAHLDRARRARCPSRRASTAATASPSARPAR